MRLVITKKLIYPEVLFAQGHLIHRWQTGVTAEIKTASKALAPPSRTMSRYGARRSSGALRRSISGTTSRAGATLLSSSISVNVPYARYVLGGTAYQGRRYIYSRAGWANKAEVDLIANRVARGGKAGDNKGLYLTLPLSNVGGRRRYHLRVHGQKANNFLVDGYNVVARAHGALRPISNRYIF